MAKKKKEERIRVPKYIHEAAQLLAPPELLTVSQWAEKYRMLNIKSSALPGNWSNDVTPYLVGVMDEFNNYETERIIFVKSTQIGGTEALQNMLGYTVMQEPSPTMIMYPTEKLAKSVSLNRLQPMLRDTPELNELYDENSPVLELQFKNNMYLVLVGSNSPTDVASRPIKNLYMDEVDKYPGASNKEADPIELAIERTRTYPNRKIYITSTPTLKTGHIWKEKEKADIEKHYTVPCPHCGKYIELRFQNIKWPDDKEMSYRDRAELATYICQECGGIINDAEKQKAIRAGRWETVRRNTKNSSSVVFWINVLYSPFVRWSDIASKFLTSKDDPEKLQNFVNSWLAEPWEDTKLKTDADMVLERQTDVPREMVPNWAKLITAGVDVQETYFYYTVRAWGDAMTSQNILHSAAISFDEIDRVLNQTYFTEDGREMYISLCLMDSGDQTEMVYDFCAPRMDYVLPCKGSSNEILGAYYKLTTIKMQMSTAFGMTLVMVDGNKYKDQIAAHMRKPIGKGSWMVHSGCDEEYARQVTAEQKVIVRKNGIQKMVWTPKTSHIDNHYLDCEVYAACAAELMGVRALMYMNEEQAQRRAQISTPEEPEQKTKEEAWIKNHDEWI